MTRTSAAIVSADFDRLRRPSRRTDLVQGALLLAVIVVFVGAYAASRGAGSDIGALLPQNTKPVVVLDASASISGPTNRRVRTTLETLANSNGTAGLVMFSDTAYELLPPGAPTRELRSLVRFFRPLNTQGSLELYPANPWAGGFSAGTRISAGLDEGRFALERAGVTSGGAVVLVSDLSDPEDPSVLAASVAELRRAHIAVRIVPLFPLAQDLALWHRLVDASRIVAPPTLPSRQAAADKQESHPFRAAVSLRLLGLCSVLVLLLTVNERIGGRLLLYTEQAE